MTGLTEQLGKHEVDKNEFAEPAQAIFERRDHYPNAEQSVRLQRRLVETSGITIGACPCLPVSTTWQ